MDFESVGVKANDQGPEVLMDLNDDPRMTEGTEVPSTDTALGSWTRLSVENQHVYKFELKDFKGEDVRKRVLGGFHPYAPLQPHGTADTSHDAYYVKVPKWFLRSNLNDQSVTFSVKKVQVMLEHKNDIYVPLRYLQALVENNVAWNPIQVLDLVTEKENFCELDKEIRKERKEWSRNKENNTKKAAKAANEAKTRMDQLIIKGKNGPIPAITTEVQVKFASPSFDFSESWGRTPTPANNITEGLGIYGVGDDTEKKALQRCLEEMHNLSSCKSRLDEGDDEFNKPHIEHCQTLSIFVKAVIPFRTESGKLCFGCHSPFPAGIKNDRPKDYEDNRKALGNIHYYDYGSMQWLWNEYWASPRAHPQLPSPKSPGWRTRYDSSPLSKPLIICLLPGARTRFYNTTNNEQKEGRKTSHPAGHAREVFGKIIEHINELEKERMSRKHTKLQLAPEQWKQSNDYCLLSEDPFRLYQTYIHKDCIHEYMQRFEDAAEESDSKNAKAVPPRKNGPTNLKTSVAQQVAPATDKGSKDFQSIRQLPVGLDCKHNDKMYEARQKSFAEYWHTDPKTTPDKKLDDQDEDEGEAEYYDSDREENNPAVQGQQIITNNTPTQKPNDEDTKPIETKSKFTKEKEEREKREDSGKKAEKEKVNPKKDMTRSIHVNPINAQKVIRAAGSRKGQKDQKAVMGFSASYFADKVLGWSWRLQTRKDRQMSNGLFIAEWLHLSAYSWGGIEQGTDAAAQKSSQTKENLVFGTSEANSCMTRYEKAWQQLFKDEKLLRDTLEAEQAKNGMMIDIEKYGWGNDKTTNLQGELSVVCNTKHGPYLFDEIDTDTKRYVWKERNPIDENSALAKLAEEFPFLAFNIRYEIRLMGQSRILAPLGSSRGIMVGTEHEPPTILHMKAMFYPFSRRFYHRSEHLLDSVLYQHMFMLGALNRFNGDRTLAEKTFGERFKKDKLNDYKSLELLIKTNTELATRVEANRYRSGVIQTEDLEDARMRYRHVVIAREKRTKYGISRNGRPVKHEEEKKEVTYMPRDVTNSSQLKDKAISDKLIKPSK